MSKIYFSNSGTITPRLDNILHFQFSGLKNIHCLFHGKNHNTAHTLGSIAFNRGENNDIIAENRKYLYEQLAMPVLEVHQIHSNILHFNPEPISYSEQAKIEGDGIATNMKGHALLIKTADCQPILFAHKNGQHIMALHAGWRGNRNDFIVEAVQKFCEEYQLIAKDLLAVRGPSLGTGQSEFINFADEWGENYRTWYHEQDKTLDLWELTRHQLEEAGLSKQNIYGLDFCTKTMCRQYFSHRENPQTGRQASIIWFE